MKQASAYYFFAKMSACLLMSVCIHLLPKKCRNLQNHAWSEFKDVTPKQFLFCNFQNSPNETGKYTKSFFLYKEKLVDR